MTHLIYFQRQTDTFVDVFVVRGMDSFIILRRLTRVSCGVFFVFALLDLVLHSYSINGRLLVVRLQIQCFLDGVFFWSIL